MPIIFRSLGVAASVLIFVGLLGCSTLDRRAVATLAGEGKSWAATVRTTQSGTRTGLNQYLDSQTLVAEIGEKDLPPDEEEEKYIKQINLDMAARVQVMDALIDTYISFEKLASYNASGEVETALNGLTGSINNYATQIKASEPPVSAVTGLIVGKTGGFAAGEIQKRQLLKASHLIREQLTRMQLLIPKEIARQKNMRTMIIEGNAAAATLLIKEGLADPEPILKDLLGNSGLAYNPAQGLAMMTNKSWLSALSKIVGRRAQLELSIEEDLLNEIKTSLEALTEAHVKFEQGEPLNTESLTQRIVFLRQFLEEIRKLKS